MGVCQWGGTFRVHVVRWAGVQLMVRLAGKYSEITLACQAGYANAERQQARLCYNGFPNQRAGRVFSVEHR